MPREPIISATPDRDEEFDRTLRPQRIKDMVGQRDVIERLNIVVDAARKRGEPLGHILFDGPPGLGKTTFANCLKLDVAELPPLAAGSWVYGTFSTWISSRQKHKRRISSGSRICRASCMAAISLT